LQREAPAAKTSARIDMTDARRTADHLMTIKTFEMARGEQSGVRL
jgi:hypothetical protein